MPKRGRRLHLRPEEHEWQVSTVVTAAQSAASEVPVAHRVRRGSVRGHKGLAIGARDATEMRISLTPRKTIQLVVSFQGIPGFIPTFPTQHQQEENKGKPAIFLIRTRKTKAQCQSSLAMRIKFDRSPLKVGQKEKARRFASAEGTTLPDPAAHRSSQVGSGRVRGGGGGKLLTSLFWGIPAKGSM